MKILEPYKKLNKVNYYIAIAVFINTATAFIHGLTLFVLNDFHSMSKVTIGVVIGLSSLMAVLGVMAGGYLCDKIGRKKVAMAGYTVAGLIFIVLSQTYLNKSMLVGGILLFSLFSSMGIMALRALNIDYTNDDNRRSALALTYIAVNAGVSISPIVAMFLYTHDKYLIEYLFIVDGAGSIILTWLIISRIKELYKYEKKPKGSQTTLREVISANKYLGYFLIGCAISYIVFMQFDYGIATTVQIVYKVPKVYSIVLLVNTIMCVTCVPIAQYIVKSFKAIDVIWFSFILYSIGFGIYAINQSTAILVTGTVLWTIGEILTVIEIDNYLITRVDKHLYGRVLSSADTLRKVTRMLSPILFSFILAKAGLEWMWLSTAILGVVAALFILKVKSMDDSIINNENVVI